LTIFRVFTALAALFLVIAVALGSMLPADEPLSQVLADLDATFLPALQSFELHHAGAWLWQGLTVPMLVRPPWLMPFSLGILCLGAATTLNWQKTPRARRR
jgi:hypothetical protein